MTTDEFREAGLQVFGTETWIAELSKTTGITRSAIHKWLRGDRTLPRWAVFMMRGWLKLFEQTGQRPVRLP